MPIDLPAEYGVQRAPEGVLAVLKSFYEDLQGLGYSVRSDGQRHPSDLQGRGNLEEFHLPRGTLVIRRFRRGGLARWASRDRFLDPERPLKEILLSTRLRELGFGTPLVVAGRAQRVGILGYRLEVITEYVASDGSLGQLLRKAWERSGQDRERALRALPWRPFGALVRRLHDAGFLHSDLQPENFLWRSQEASLVILDLDRSRLRESDAWPDDALAQNLWRLWRYVLRRDAQGPHVLRAGHYLRFLRAYEPDRTRRRAWVQRLTHLRQTRSRWHRGQPKG